MTNSTQVAIIGGGAMGASTAYYLAKAGIRSTIIERDGIATKASGYNAGGLNPLTGYGLPGPLTDISNVTFRMHAELAQCLEEESGVPYHHKTIAIVSVAFDDSDLPEMRDTHDAFQAADDRFTSHWLDAADLRNMEPRLNPEAQRGLYTHGHCSLSGYEFTLALARAAERNGAQILHTEATGIDTDGDRVTAVNTRDGKIPCDAVVIASGPWSAQAEQWLGVKIPVEPYKGEILRLSIPGESPRARLLRRRRKRPQPRRRPPLGRRNRAEKRLRPRTLRLRPRHPHERRNHPHALPQRRQDSKAHRLPPPPHTRLAPHRRRRPRLEQRPPSHRRRQKRHPLRPRHRQSHRRPNHHQHHRHTPPRLRPHPLRLKSLTYR